MKSLLLCLSLLLVAPVVSLANDVNFAKIRGTLVNNYYDCSGFGCSINHGCLWDISTFANDPLTVHIAYGVGSDCSSVETNTCVQVIGTVGAYTSNNVSVPVYQVEVASWLTPTNCGF